MTQSWKDYNFSGECEVCESDEQPPRSDTGMCDPCTFGEADSIWDWCFIEDWNTAPVGVLCKASRRFNRIQHKMWKVGIDFSDEIWAGIDGLFKALEDREKHCNRDEKRKLEENRRRILKEWGSDWDKYVKDIEKAIEEL